MSEDPWERDDGRRGLWRHWATEPPGPREVLVGAAVFVLTATHAIGLAVDGRNFLLHAAFIIVWIALGSTGLVVFLFPPPRIRGMVVLLAVTGAACLFSARLLGLVIP